MFRIISNIISNKSVFLIDSIPTGTAILGPSGPGSIYFLLYEEYDDNK